MPITTEELSFEESEAASVFIAHDGNTLLVEHTRKNGNKERFGLTVDLARNLLQQLSTTLSASLATRDYE